MTIEERARQIVSLPPFLDYMPTCKEEVARAITAAVLEEREACARIVEEKYDYCLKWPRLSASAPTSPLPLL